MIPSRLVAPLDCHPTFELLDELTLLLRPRGRQLRCGSCIAIAFNIATMDLNLQLSHLLLEAGQIVHSRHELLMRQVFLFIKITGRLLLLMMLR